MNSNASDKAQSLEDILDNLKKYKLMLKVNLKRINNYYFFVTKDTVTNSIVKVELKQAPYQK